MNTFAPHSFSGLHDAMRAVAVWLDGPAPHAGQTPGTADHHSLRALCADGLRCIAAHAGEYDRLIARPNVFVTHFAASVAALAPTAALAATPSGHDARTMEDQLDDAAFMLVEDMAALFRERSLRAPEALRYDAEQALLDHFEQSGEWLPADGTTITDWYYVRLPALVLTQLLRRAEAARGSCPPITGQAEQI